MLENPDYQIGNLNDLNEQRTSKTAGNYKSSGLLNDVEELDFDVDENLNKNKTTVSEQTIIDVCTEDGYDYEYYQNKLNELLKNETDQRKRAVICAEFLATEFPKLPYFWGGGHYNTYEELQGINPNWGLQHPCSEKCVDDATGEELYTQGESYIYSLDCSGFVSWCLVNAGYDYTNINPVSLNTNSAKELGNMTAITETNINDILPGDIAYMDGHVGMVIDVDSSKKEITIANVSYSSGGMQITTMSTDTGLVVDNNFGNIIPNSNVSENNYTNQNNTPIEPGSAYFTDIIHVDY